jgi:hypothetical protein
LFDDVRLYNSGLRVGSGWHNLMDLMRASSSEIRRNGDALPSRRARYPAVLSNGKQPVRELKPL